MEEHIIKSFSEKVPEETGGSIWKRFGETYNREFGKRRPALIIQFVLFVFTLQSQLL